MREFEYPLARAKRVRARRAAMGGSSLAICAGLALLLVGTDERRGYVPGAGPALEIAAAQAMDSPDRRPVSTPTPYIMSIPPEALGIRRPIDIWATPVSVEDSAPAVELAHAVESSQPGAGAPTPDSMPPGEPARDTPVIEAQQVTSEKQALSPVAEAAPKSAEHVEAAGKRLVTEQPSATNVLFEHTSLGAPRITLPPAPAPLAAPTPTPAAPTLRSLSGKWAGHLSACSTRNKNTAYLPLVLSERGAKAGGASCTFGKTAQAGNRWTVAATCRDGQESWTATVRLALAGTKLTWSSERGSETYLRCK